MALGKYIEVFIMHITFLLTIEIKLIKKAKITLLITKKVKILIKYLDFLDVFL